MAYYHIIKTNIIVIGETMSSDISLHSAAVREDFLPETWDHRFPYSNPLCSHVPVLLPAQLKESCIVHAEAVWAEELAVEIITTN